MPVHATELVGKAREEIVAILRRERPRRDVLEGMVAELASIEPTVTKTELARIRNKHPRTIDRLVKSQKLRAFCWTGKNYDISVPSIRALDEKTAIGAPSPHRNNGNS